MAMITSAQIAIAAHKQLVILEQAYNRQREFLSHVIGGLDPTSLAAYDQYRDVYEAANGVSAV